MAYRHAYACCFVVLLPALCLAQGTLKYCNGAGYDTNQYVCINFPSGSPFKEPAVLCPVTQSCVCYTPSAGSDAGCFSPQEGCGANTPTVANSRVCASASGTQDPLLTGFDGRTFDFHGKAEQVFNFVTEQDHQLNAAFTAANLHDHFEGGTFITAIGMMANIRRVNVTVKENGQLAVTDDEFSVTPGTVDERLGSKLTVADDEHSVTLSTSLFTWTAVGVGPETKEALNCAADCTQFWKAHMDVQMTLMSPPGALHGALGQTFRSLSSSSNDMAFHGDGVEADYEVDSLFGTAFKYNLYGQKGNFHVSRALLGRTAKAFDSSGPWSPLAASAGGSAGA